MQAGNNKGWAYIASDRDSGRTIDCKCTDYECRLADKNYNRFDHLPDTLPNDNNGDPGETGQ